MVEILQVATYIYQRYCKEFGGRIDEMKLHKLLYFTQRECLIQTGQTMFEARFEAWKYGPVMVCIRHHYKTDSFHDLMTKEQIAQFKPVFDMTFKIYAPQNSWSLSTLTHGEYSWKHAREGYDEQDSCEVEMKTEDIMVDASRVRERRTILGQLNLYKA